MSTTQTITAENVTNLFPEVHTRLIGADLPPNTTNETTNGSVDADLSGYDAEQIRLMDEVCIVLDYNDKAIGTASKKDCHLMSNIDKGLLHRAFRGSVQMTDGHCLLPSAGCEVAVRS